VDAVVTDAGVSTEVLAGLTNLGIRTLVAGESSVEVHGAEPSLKRAP
jgi:hypothetical protein